jgi:D-glycero-alpha-D-manno-heptose-7-phosphate kinase
MMSIVISRTPYRISFFGGGSDYPDWYLREGGAVLSTSIDKYCYISARQLPPFFGIRHRIVWKHIEQVNSISEILHPAVREGMKHLGFDDQVGMEIQYQGDLPARSGVGSSSSFSVGLINALLTLRGERLSQRELAWKSIELEQHVLKEPVGSQDQMAAAIGGLNVFRFCTDGTIRTEPVVLPMERQLAIEGRLMLFYTGISRLGAQVAKDVIDNLAAKQAVVRQMIAMVDAGRDVLEGGELDDFGRMLHETWLLKRSISRQVSTSLVDDIYDTARDAGAIGGKLLGAGNSGFMLFYVPEESQVAVAHALRHFLQVPFGFEATGASIIHDAGRNSVSDAREAHLQLQRRRGNAA